MPSSDAGFYHLTSLIPIHRGEEASSLWRWDPQSTTAVHSLRELLDSFRSVDVPDLEEEEHGRTPIARPVPFSRNERTHFARLVVVEALAYNGIKPPDTLIGLARGLLGSEVPLREKADQLPGPYLLVLIDFDCPGGDPRSVADYLAELWLTMEQEWTLILRHCPGFEASDPLRRQRSYMALLLDHEIESTFSFASYAWAAERARRWQPTTGRFLPRRSGSQAWPLLPLALWAVCVVIGLVLALMLLVRLLVGLPLSLLALALAAPGVPLPSWLSALRLEPAVLPSLLIVLMALGVLTLLALPLWQRLLRQANRPWPAQPGTDLRSVLKALHLQRSFLALAEGWQNRPAGAPGSLRSRFRDVLQETQPDNLEGPALRPGQIASIRRHRQP